MIDSILISRGVKKQNTLNLVKMFIAIGVVALSVASPFIAHMFFGARSGLVWLPMYYPILLGGLLLGSVYGGIVGAVAPIVSFILTSLMGSPMPVLTRLPFMIVELATFGIVSGLFSTIVSKKSYMAFPIVLLTELVGRGLFLLLVTVFNRITPLTPSLVWSQILMGWPGLLSSFVVVPLIVMLVSLLNKDKE